MDNYKEQMLELTEDQIVEIINKHTYQIYDGKTPLVITTSARIFAKAYASPNNDNIENYYAKYLKKSPGNDYNNLGERVVFLFQVTLMTWQLRRQL